VTAEVLAAGRLPASAVSATATRSGADVLRDVGVVDGEGLTAAEAATRLASSGPNAVVSHRVGAWSVLLHQLRSPLLGLLVVAAVASDAVGEQSGAVIIVVIVGLSVGLGFVNEFRAEKAAEALHTGIRHHATVLRDGRQATVDVTTLVPGDTSSCAWATSSRRTSGCWRSADWSATSRC
jgi:P-type Mg2+ transporter